MALSKKSLFLTCLLCAMMHSAVGLVPINRIKSHSLTAGERSGKKAEIIALPAVETQTYSQPLAGIPVQGAPPPPIAPPTKEEAEAAVIAAKTGAPGLGMNDILASGGEAPLVPDDLASRAANLARDHMDHIFKNMQPPPADVFDVFKNKSKSIADPATSSGAVRRGPPKPPHCAAPPRNLTKADVQMAMKPFLPSGTEGEPYALKDGGSAFKLKDGGWAFQYPDMVARTELRGATRIAWPEQQYAVEYDPTGISYHKGDTVIHRDVSGDLIYHQPTGTIHQEGDTVIYHWCHPNVIVYHTPSGLVYYNDDGMTYRGDGGLAYYASTGDVVYQGTGGITRQSPEGEVQHWTDSGVIYRHRDGSMTYTPVGEFESHPLASDELGTDPFPGPPLSVDDVQKLVRSAARWEGQHEAADAAVRTAAYIVEQEGKEALSVPPPPALTPLP